MGAGAPAPFARRFSSADADNIAKQFGMSMPLSAAVLPNAALVCNGTRQQPWGGAQGEVSRERYRCESTIDSRNVLA